MLTVSQILLFFAIFSVFRDISVPSIIFVTSLSTQQIRSITNVTIDEYIKVITKKGLNTYNTKEISKQRFVVTWRGGSDPVFKSINSEFNKYFDISMYVNRTDRNGTTRMKYVKKRGIDFGAVHSVRNAIVKIQNYEAFSDDDRITSFISDIRYIMQHEEIYKLPYHFWVNLASKCGLNICNIQTFNRLIWNKETATNIRDFQSMKTFNFDKKARLSDSINRKNRNKRRTWKTTTDYV